MISDLYKRIELAADILQIAANQGNQKALAVIQFYELHHRCPSDPGALAMLEDAMAEWEAAQ